jgi:hypothetical protein
MNLSMPHLANLIIPLLGRFRPAPRNAIEEQIGRALALVLKMIQADFWG